MSVIPTVFLFVLSFSSPLLLCRAAASNSSSPFSFLLPFCRAVPRLPILLLFAVSSFLLLPCRAEASNFSSLCSLSLSSSAVPHSAHAMPRFLTRLLLSLTLSPSAVPCNTRAVLRLPTFGPRPSCRAAAVVYRDSARLLRFLGLYISSAGSKPGGITPIL